MRKNWVWLKIIIEMKLEELFDELDFELLAEMANLSSKDTGLPMNIYVSDDSIKNSPRIKVQTDHSPRFKKDHLLVSVTISNNPQVIGNNLSKRDEIIIKEFIRRNKILLTRYWNRQIGIDDVVDGLVKYTPAMKQLKPAIKEILDATNLEFLTEMANLPSKKTGLPMNIYISDNSGVKHGPRIKVQTDHSPKFRKDLLVSMTIDREPKVIGRGLSGKDEVAAREFIVRNINLLTQYWNKQISIGNVTRNLIKHQAEVVVEDTEKLPSLGFTRLGNELRHRKFFDQLKLYND